MLAAPVSAVAPCCVVPSALFRASSVNTILPKSMLPLSAFVVVTRSGMGASSSFAVMVNVNLPLMSFGVKPSAWLKRFTPVTLTDASPVPYVFSKAKPLSPASMLTASAPEPPSTALMVNGIG